MCQGDFGLRKTFRKKKTKKIKVLVHPLYESSPIVLLTPKERKRFKELKGAEHKARKAIQETQGTIEGKEFV